MDWRGCFTVLPMSATRKLRDGTVAIASTLYIDPKVDAKAQAIADERTAKENRKVSKAQVLKETIESHIKP